MRKTAIIAEIDYLIIYLQVYYFRIYNYRNLPISGEKQQIFAISIYKIIFPFFFSYPYRNEKEGIALLETLFEKLNSFIWGPGLLALVLGTGVWFTVRSGFYPLRKFAAIRKTTLGSLKDKKGGFAAMMTALGATVGTGNIVGVAFAIAVGGAGSIFWMWVGAFFGMMLKFSEAALAVRFKGGAPVYIQKALSGKRAALFWSLCCVLSSFGVGNTVQIAAASTAAETAFDLPPFLVGTLAALLVAMVCIGGTKTVTKVSSVLVPLMALFYLLGGLFLLWQFREAVPASFALIFRDAFSESAAAGGFSGFLTSKALRVGITRGTFTHEAGMGSAALAHAESEEKDPATQGNWGILEVFADSFVCTVTALVLLSSGVSLENEESTFSAFAAGFGAFGEKFLSVGLFLFALAAMIGWEFYGERALSALTGRKTALVGYRLFFCLLTVAGSFLPMALLWDLSDIFNGLMLLPNLMALLLLRKEIFGFIKRKSP